MAETEVVFDNQEVREFLDNIGKKTKAIADRDQKVVGILSSIVFADIIQHFERSEGPDGPWAKWSPRYAKFMASIGRQGNKILINNGRLRQNFRPTNVRRTSDGLSWYNNAVTASGFPYAAAHNEGGPKLPQRRFMWLSDKAIDEIETQIVKFLED